MAFNLDSTLFVSLLVILLACQCNTQAPEVPKSSARALDSLLQDYAYQVLIHRTHNGVPRTGTPYVGQVPANLTGINIAALRLRSGSLKYRGFRTYKQFEVPVDVFVQPYVERLVLVYQDLGNWSSVYYPLPGFTYLAPVLGLLAYNGVNLSASGLPELDFKTSRSPILINFTDFSPATSGLIPTCVWFDLDGVPQFTDLVSSNVCSSYQQGHYSIVVNNARLPPPPSPTPGPSPQPRLHKSSSKAWKIIVGIVGGLAIVFLLALFVAWIRRCIRDKRRDGMVLRSEAGEALQMQQIGNARLPMARVLRTQPVRENEYVP